MVVLSLFDGISCGQVALERASIPVQIYYSSEIEPSSIKVTQDNYPNTVQLGDIRTLTVDMIPHKVDLLLAGTPCTNLSFSGKRQGMVTNQKVKVTTLEQYMSLKQDGFNFSGQSYLFWQAMRLMRDINPTYFLFQNVVMQKMWQDVITDTIGVQPIKINSALVSAQNRVRLYWTNIPNVTQPKDKHIELKDILETTEWVNPGAVRGRDVVLNKATIIGRRINEYGNRQDYNKKIPMIQCLQVRSSNRNKSNCLTTVDKDNVLTPLPVGRYVNAFGKCGGERLPFRNYTRTQYERLQTLPQGYTKVLSQVQAKKAIGNGWTVDVISHILQGLKYTDIKENVVQRHFYRKQKLF